MMRHAFVCKHFPFWNLYKPSHQADFWIQLNVPEKPYISSFLQREKKPY